MNANSVNSYLNSVDKYNLYYLLTVLGVGQMSQECCCHGNSSWKDCHTFDKPMTLLFQSQLMSWMEILFNLAKTLSCTFVDNSHTFAVPLILSSIHSDMLIDFWPGQISGVHDRSYSKFCFITNMQVV